MAKRARVTDQAAKHVQLGETVKVFETDRRIRLLAMIDQMPGASITFTNVGGHVRAEFAFKAEKTPIVSPAVPWDCIRTMPTVVSERHE
jgi:hypothetical protein